MTIKTGEAVELRASSTVDFEAIFGVVVPPAELSKAEQESRPKSLQALKGDTASVLKTYMESAVKGLLITRTLHSTSPILWVIDESGSFLFALEEVVDLADGSYIYPLPRGLRPPPGYAKLGHPSLLGGASGRIGGELTFDPGSEDGGAWVLTNKSGRYGLVPDRTEHHLKNVAELCQKHGILATVKFITPPQSR